MKTFAKTALIVLTLAATTAPSFAQGLNWTTGIGFGENRTQAVQAAVRAWMNQSYRDHGDMNWNTAFKGPMECFQSQQQPGGITSFGIGVEGNPSGSWSCSVTGVPLSVVNG